MTLKEPTLQKATDTREAESLREKRRLEKMFKKSGQYDGRLLCFETKATYTFVYENQVMVLHFDLDRQHFYCNGHRVVNLLNGDNLPEFLVMFKKALVEQGVESAFVRGFDIVVSSLYQDTLDEQDREADE